MQVNITFRNMFATDALRNHVQDKLEKVVNKHLDKVSEAHVILSLERYLHQAEINLHAGHFHVRAKEKSEDMYASIDLATAKIERQLKKHKERLKSHRPAHVHQNAPVRIRLEVLSSGETYEGEPPEIISNTEFLAKPMSVEEALMQMDLLNNDFLVFTRAGGGTDVNVIYRRKDGTVGHIAPAGESTVAGSDGKGGAAQVAAGK